MVLGTIYPPISLPLMFLETREYFVGYHENIAFEGDDESSRKLKFMVAFNDIFNDICGCKSLEII